MSIRFALASIAGSLSTLVTFLLSGDGLMSLGVGFVAFLLTLFFRSLFLLIGDD